MKIHSLWGPTIFSFPQERRDDAVKGIPSIGIGSDTHVHDAIIDKNARIGPNVRIINKDSVQEGSREDEGIWIKDGIIIVTKNAVVPSNTVI